MFAMFPYSGVKLNDMTSFNRAWHFPWAERHMSRIKFVKSGKCYLRLVWLESCSMYNERCQLQYWVSYYLHACNSLVHFTLHKSSDLQYCVTLTTCTRSWGGVSRKKNDHWNRFVVAVSDSIYQPHYPKRFLTGPICLQHLQNS